MRKYFGFWSLQAFKCYLYTLGFDKVLDAKDALTAIHLFQENDIDLVISTREIPLRINLELLNKVRRSPQHTTPFIIITIFNKKEKVIEAVKSEAGDYIVKPLTIETSKEKIKAELNRHRDLV